MKTVTHRTPVAVFYPPTEQYIIVQRGDEYPNDHPFVKDKANAYLFAEEDPGEGARLYAAEPVEQATKAPGEKRAYVRRPKDDGEKVDPKGNGPIRSGDR